MAEKNVFEGKIVSRSRRGDRAQVIVTFDGRPVTRHVRLEDGHWMGPNPNPLAIPVHEAKDAFLGQVGQAIEHAEEALESAEMAVKEGREEAAGLVSFAIALVKMTGIELAAAIELKKTTEQELPLMVQYLL